MQPQTSNEIVGRTKFSSLHVAFTCCCTLALLVLLVLWLRSYWWADDLKIQMPGSRLFILHSMQGSTAWYAKRMKSSDARINLQTESVEQLMEGLTPLWRENHFHIQVSRRPFTIPHWMLIAIAAILAVVPWTTRRFSLRSAFVALTAVAILLGTGIVVLD